MLNNLSEISEKKDFTNFLKSFGIFLVPFTLLFAFVFLIDPFNYFNQNSIVSEKKYYARKKQNFIWNFIENSKQKPDNILLGDSRMLAFKSDYIKTISGDTYLNMASAGSSIIENIESFWFANKTRPLKNVVWSINPSQYNGLDTKNRATEAEYLMERPWMYFINKNVLESSFMLFKDKLTNKKTDLEKPPMEKEEFWQYKLKVDAKKYFKDYVYPTEAHSKLIEVSDFCKKNHINLKFIIFPVHADLQIIAKEKYKHELEIEQMKKDLKTLGEVSDYYLIDSLTSNKDNFNDPFHFNEAVAKELMQSIFSR